MQFLFVDESGTPSERVFAIGGVAVRADDWPAFRQRWLGVLARHAWPVREEIKWHYIHTGRIPPAMADDLYAELARSEATCFVVILRPLAARRERPDLFATDEDVYQQGLMYLTERFHRCLGRGDDYGAIVVDHRIDDVDARLRRFFDELLTDGTPYMRLDRLVDTVLLGPSHHSIGLQAADLVVGCTLASRDRLGDASRWHRQLHPRFARHPDTLEIDGAGLVEFPKQPQAKARGKGKLTEEV